VVLSLVSKKLQGLESIQMQWLLVEHSLCGSFLSPPEALCDGIGDRLGDRLLQ
jgi:hypothetical protein